MFQIPGFVSNEIVVYANRLSSRHSIQHILITGKYEEMGTVLGRVSQLATLERGVLR